MVGTLPKVRGRSPLTRRAGTVTVALALLAAACSVSAEQVLDDSELALPLASPIPEPTATSIPEPTATAVPEPTPTTIPEPTAAPTPTTSRSDAGLGSDQVVMARANWSSGYIQAQIVHNILEELGYDVSSPHENEFAPDIAYFQIGRGEVDLWANSWYPGHLSWWDATPGDLARLDTPLVPSGGLQGFLVTRSWAEENGVTTIDQINADPALVAQLDRDGNGKGEMYGCFESWTCNDIIESQIEFAGWSNLEQLVFGYDSMFAEFITLVRGGEPAIAYTWTPTSYVAMARPGDLTMWISLEDASVLDDSNPLNLEDGEQFSQRSAGGIGGSTDIETCLVGPDGCQLGWRAEDIEITANGTWLAANPPARALFEAMNLNAIELSTLGVALADSDGSQQRVEEIAAGWIAENRDRVDAWLDAAEAAEAAG